MLALSLLLLCATIAFGSIRTYQVTGPVLEVTPDMIAVKKGADRWEIARDATTKITGDFKVGSKVTIEYGISATSVKAREEKAKPAKSSKKN